MGEQVTVEVEVDETVRYTYDEETVEKMREQGRVPQDQAKVDAVEAMAERIESDPSAYVTVEEVETVEEE